MSLFFQNPLRLIVAISLASCVCLAESVDELTKDGRAAFDRNEFDLAIKEYTKVIQLDPSNENAYYVRGWVYAYKGNRDLAIMDFKKSISLCTNSVSTSSVSTSYSYRSLADIFLMETDYDSAISNYSIAVAYSPQFADAYAARGGAYYGKGESRMAIEDCNTAISLNPELAEAYIFRATAFAQLGDYGRAISDCSEVIQKNPSFGRDKAFEIRGAAYVSQSRFDLAKQDYDQAVSLDPRNPVLLAGRGEIKLEIGDSKGGIEDCRAAIRLDTNCFIAYNNLAWLLSVSPAVEMRNGQEALKYAKKAYELTSGSDSHVAGTLAAAYAETGDFDEAVKWQKRSIDGGLTGKDLKQAQDLLKLYLEKKPYRAEHRPVK